MAEETPPTPAEVERQVRQHAESLRAAGVEWLPNAPLPPAQRAEPRPVPLPVVEAAPPALQPSLFASGGEAPAGGDLTPEQRCQELAALAERVSRCTRCASLVVSRTQTVFGVGPLDPELCFVGEAPGADEDAQGEPFVGQAGQLLNRIIAACGMKREEVYICNILRCLHGFTKVLTEHGWQQVQRIVARRYAGKVAAVDESGALVWGRITGHHRSPREGRRLVKLCLHSSRQGRRPAGGVFTEDHEVLTDRGYKRIYDLDPIADRVHSGTYQPSLDVRQAIVGMLLGDARFARKTNSFSVAHCEAQRDYVYHKAKLLGVPDSKVKLVSAAYEPRGKTYRRLAFACKATPFFRQLGKTFYPAGRKAILAECLRDFGVISLAYLFMDDGYMRLRPGRAPLAEIATCCFTRDEVELLLRAIRELGVHGYTLPNKRYPRALFDAENTALLSHLIAPYVLESMDYKLIPEHRALPKATLSAGQEAFYDSFTVQTAAPLYSRSCKTVYCLSIERYGNFLTTSGVVHNCRPPGNRTPLPQEAANCREYLERTLELVRPKFLCALGACAAQNLLGTTQGIGRLRGRFHDYKGIPVLCTYHPAFLLPNRSPERKKDVWEDMKKLLARMGRPVPPR
jgi:uracil-DNA glycosylase family 4